MAAFEDTWLETIFVEGDRAVPLASENNLMALLPMQKASGGVADQPFTLAGTRTTAGSYADSKTKGTNAGGGSAGLHFKWLVPTGEMTHDIRIKDKDLQMSEGPQARANALQLAVEQGVKQFGQDLSNRFGGASGGSYGSGTYVSGSSFTLTFDDPDNARFLSPGQILDGATTDGTSGSALAQKAAVVSVNVDTGAVVLGTEAGGGASAASPGAAWAAEDGNTLFLFNGYTFNTSLTDQVFGVAEWCPLAAATSTIANVIRSVDTRLSGVRLTTAEAGSLSLADRVIELCAKGKDIAGWVNGDRYAIFNPRAWSVLCRQLATLYGSNAVQVKTGQYGFSYVSVYTDVGEIKCISDRSCPKNIFRVIDFASAKVRTSNSKLVDFAKTNGALMSQLADGTNDHVVRPVCYNQVTPGNPAHHGVGSTSL